MSRARLLILVGVMAVFIAAGGVLIYTSQHRGGQILTFDLSVTGTKTMTPADISAHVGDTITINVKSDTDGEVHLHVYDIAFNTKAGQTVSHTFKADKTCGCDLEWESTSTPLGRLTVSP